MKVEPPTAAGELADEDDISEPDEDSIAGQMAMLKGQPVRRIRSESDEDDDDTSGTEEEEEEDDSSDSDSD